MFDLFGHPSDAFHAAYQEVAPLADGWRARLALWQLDPAGPHQPFGGAYATQDLTRLRTLTCPPKLMRCGGETTTTHQIRSGWSTSTLRAGISAWRLMPGLERGRSTTPTGIDAFVVVQPPQTLSFGGLVRVRRRVRVWWRRRAEEVGVDSMGSELQRARRARQPSASGATSWVGGVERVAGVPEEVEHG